MSPLHMKRKESTNEACLPNIFKEMSVTKARAVSPSWVVTKALQGLAVRSHAGSDPVSPRNNAKHRQAEVTKIFFLLWEKTPIFRNLSFYNFKNILPKIIDIN